VGGGGVGTQRLGDRDVSEKNGFVFHFFFGFFSVLYVVLGYLTHDVLREVRIQRH